MEEELNSKEVYFGQYCGKCKFRKLPENEEPCEECLTNSMRYNSHKPLKFEKGALGHGGKQVSTKRQ